MSDYALKIFLAVFCPLVVAFIIALVNGYIAQRDAIRDLKRETKWLEEDYQDLKDKYEKDKVERSSLTTMAASLDIKIDAKLKDILSDLAEQRRIDNAMFQEAITQQNATFSKAVSELSGTLREVNIKLGFLTKDFYGKEN